jgi:hypothetical protein
MLAASAIARLMILITRFLPIFLSDVGRSHLTLTIVGGRQRRARQSFFQLLMNPIAIFVGHYRNAEEDALIANAAFSFAVPSRTDK